jgi:DNA processing protein
MTNHAEHQACLQLLLCEARSGKLREALDHYQSAGDAWYALRQLDARLSHGLKSKQRLLERGLEWLQGANCHMLAWHQASYPEALRNVASPPPFIFVCGQLDLLWHPQIAIVGSRKASAGGLESAHYFARQLAQQGYTITSGLASGIDAAAHQGALCAGHTIAALATGPDMAFPRGNQALYEQICQHGAVITEHPPGVPALRSHFPARNRLIAGLSLGTLVIEAAIPSGALITARLAAELGKEVMAVPGSIHNPTVYGCHQLIREGAYLVEQPEEVAHILASSRGHMLPSAVAQMARTSAGAAPDVSQMNGAQQQLWQALGYESVAIDTLCLRTGLTAADISSILIGMELSGWVENHGGRYHKGCQHAPPARG